MRYRGTIAELLSRFINSVNHMSIHLFHFRWQAFRFDECKKQLQDGDVLLIMDFATNYSQDKQDEVQVPSGVGSKQHCILSLHIIPAPASVGTWFMMKS